MIDELSDYDFSMRLFGWATIGPNEFTALIAENGGVFHYNGHEPWDRTADDLATMRLYDKGQELVTPWWWALPNVTTHILRYGKAQVKA